LAALLGGISLGRGGWGRPAVVVLFAVATVLLAVFVVVEARTREPMLDLNLFRRPGFVVSTTGAFFTGFAAVGMMSYLPTVADRALGEPPLAAGATLTLWAGVSFAVSLCARRLGVRIQARHQVAAGLLLTAAGHLAMLGLTEHTGWWRLAPGLVVAGTGVGLLNGALARLAVESVPAGRAGMGSGAGNTARYIGGSMGVAVVAAIATTARSGSPAHALARGADVALAVTAAVAVAGAIVALAIRSDEG
jgi:predicted small integral membrane protein